MGGAIITGAGAACCPENRGCKSDRKRGAGSRKQSSRLGKGGPGREEKAELQTGQEAQGWEQTAEQQRARGKKPKQSSRSGEGAWAGSRKPPQEPAPPPACVAGRYSPEKAGKWAFPTAPIYSLASRTKEFSNDQTPGRPGRAAWRVPPPPAGSRLRSDPSARPPTTPSLGARATRALLRSPLAQTPGPCNYRAVDSNVYKARAPQFSMLARNVLPGDNTQKPGPGTYSPEKHRGQTFGIRHSDYLAPLIVDVAD
uniref:Ciliary microtubule associated protein 1B n=1 Tax=Crocodylus porosus TaxID=8502 RepID=A0A7M4E625_CROPO